MPGSPVLHCLPVFAQTWWCHTTISSSAILFSFAFVFPSIGVFSSESALHIRWPKYWSFSFSLSPSNEYSEFDWLVWFPCSPRDSQESSPVPQFKTISSPAICLLYGHLLYGPTLTSIHDYWKNHSFDYTNLIEFPVLYNRSLLSILYAAAAAAAKSLQLCPTLCDPIDGSPPGSPVPGNLQARTLEWVAVSFSNAGKWKVKVKLLSCVQLLATSWTAAHQAPPSMGPSRQEYLGFSSCRSCDS